MYKNIKLYENVQYDYLYVDKGSVAEDKIEIADEKNWAPTWRYSEENPIPVTPFIVAHFNGDTKSSRIEGMPSALEHWSLYRQRDGENRQYLVANIDKDLLFAVDYMCTNQQGYKYTLIPVFEEELGVSISSDKFKPNWDGYLIIGLDEISKNEYTPNCVWNFKYNLTPEAITHNIDVTTVETFTRYPKIVSGDRNYVTTGLSCLINDIDCVIDKNKSTPLELYEKWEDFVSQRKPCLFKNDMGIVKFGYIKDSPTFKYDYGYSETPLIISFSFVETGAVDDITIYDIQNDTSEE